MEENEFESFMDKLKGKSKKHFVTLLEQLGEANDMIEAHDETISKMEGHSRAYANEISDLSNDLAKERGHHLALEESHNDDHAKLKKDLDHALVVSRVLTFEKAKLGADHARLKEEFDVLDKAHKVLKGAHATSRSLMLNSKLSYPNKRPPFLIWYYLIMQIPLACVVSMCILWRRMPS